MKGENQSMPKFCVWAKLLALRVKRSGHSLASVMDRVHFGLAGDAVVINAKQTKRDRKSHQIMDYKSHQNN
jgi:hypothetical protein